jgi:hypothetical protein
MQAKTEKTARIIKATAESLWDVSETILSTGYATADDWELARAAASHMLAALTQATTERTPNGHR